ncbi:DNA helicase [Spironucleus salmonicida]|nr:DNA helicase [Spironucleus salmonicida]
MHLFILDSYEKSNSLEVWLLPFSKLNPKLFDIYNKNGKKLSFIHLSKFQLMLQYFNQLTDTIQRQNFNQFSLNFLKNLAAIYNKNLSKDIQLQNFEYQIHDFQIPSKSSVQLNDYQYKAFKTVIDSYVQENSYQTLFLIRGVFGSGKSQTLVNLIQHLYYLFGDEFKILVTAITNTAIDNILARLSVTDIPQRLFQRLGSNLANKNLSDYQRDTFNPSCFASFVTCSSISKCQCQQFDLVIVDEASQMKEFEYIYISSLVQSHKIILCGDPAQLPPISSIQSIEKSIFQRFIEAGMEVISLWEQYRCNKHISALSSMFFYNGNVVTNIDPYLIILQQKLLDYQFEKEDYDKNLPASSNKIKIKHNFKNNFGIMPPVATFHLKSQDEKCNQSRVNKIEAYSIKDFIVYLLNSSQFLLIQIGVITPYRAQSDFLREMLPEGILVSTVDAFQGDERQIIIFSHVKTENSGIDSFVENGCRVNVALSRAQYSFIVFKGQSCTNGYWGKFQKYSEKNNWIFASIQEFQTWQAQFSNSEYEEIYELMDKPTFVITKPQPVILTENKEQIKSKFKKVLKFQKEDPDRKNWSSWTKPVEEKQVTIQDIEVITLDKCLELLNYNFQHRQLELKLLPCDNYKDILKSLIEFNKSHQ